MNSANARTVIGARARAQTNEGVLVESILRGLAIGAGIAIAVTLYGLSWLPYIAG